jgi:hypothetical protein
MNSRRVVRKALGREPTRGERAVRVLQVAGVVILAVGVAAGLAALVVRDQMARHRRELFSPHPLRRLAALGYLGRREATVDAVRLLRDYIRWETRPILRRRAAQILERMSNQLATAPAPTGGIAG